MPGLQSSCHLRRFRDFHLRTLGFVVPTHSIGPKKFAAFRESQPGCMTLMSIAVCRPAASSWYSDLIQRFSTNCVHKEIVQLFRTKFHLRNELCNRFLSRPSECTLHHQFQIGHGRHRLKDERPFTPLRVATRESRTLHHARIHLPYGCHRRLNTCSLGCASL